jgi:hypothetical protein
MRAFKAQEDEYHHQCHIGLGLEDHIAAAAK